MGKAARWLRGLLGMKKDKENEENFSSFSDKKEKKRWSFGKTIKDSGGVGVTVDSSWMRSSFAAAVESEKEQNSHAIAVAAATAAAADAAVAAAQAAVAVVRLTSRGRGALFATQRENWAALKIQSVFRGYLARKALRALRGLVKLQAHVRGYLVRKRAAATLHSMQALIRAQATVRSQRIRCMMTNETRFRNFIERFDECRSAVQSKRLPNSYDPSLNGLDESPKIVEIDTYKLRSMSRRINNASFYNSGSDLDGSFVGEESNFPTAQSTPRAAPGSGRAGAPAPVKSVCGDSFFRPYLNSPGYMGKTESFRAKQRSVSAPKQRPEAAPPGRKRVSLGEIMASRNSSSGGKMQRSCSQVQKQHGF